MGSFTEQAPSDCQTGSLCESTRWWQGPAKALGQARPKQLADDPDWPPRLQWA